MLGRGKNTFCRAYRGVLPIIHKFVIQSLSEYFLDFEKSIQLLQLSRDPTHAWVFILFLDMCVVSETALQLFPRLPHPLAASSSHSRLSAGAVLPMMCHSIRRICILQHSTYQGKVFRVPSLTEMMWGSQVEIHEAGPQDKPLLDFVW